MIEYTCDSNYLQLYGSYLLIKGQWVLNCRYRELKVGVRVIILHLGRGLGPEHIGVQGLVSLVCRALGFRV